MREMADLHDGITVLVRGGKKKEVIYSVYLWSCSSVFYHPETSSKSPHWGNESQGRRKKMKQLLDLMNSWENKHGFE